MNTYSKAFMLKSQTMDISKICPIEISRLKIEIENIIMTLPSQKTDNIRSKKRIDQKWERAIIHNVIPPLPIKKTIINKLSPDIKRITSILNKISDENYDKMVEEAKTFNHVDSEVVSVIFKKILAEPFFSDIYARFCSSLDDLHEIINECCLIEFKKCDKTKHKNLGKFIGELYKLKVLDDLDEFLDELMNDIDESKLETLCKIINTIGHKNDIFQDIIAELQLIKCKNRFGSRHNFMIMDLVEGRR